MSVIQQRPSIDLTLGSVLLGFGLLKLSKAIRWLTLVSLVVQVLMCAWVLHDVINDVGLIGESRMFSYILFDTNAHSLKLILIFMIIVLSLQFVYLVLPTTRHLFKAGPPA